MPDEDLRPLNGRDPTSSSSSSSPAESSPERGKIKPLTFKNDLIWQTHHS